MEEDSKGTELSNVIRIDDERVRDHLGRIVRGTVEETLNAMLEAEADRLCNAGRYERTEARRDQRSGSYDRKLQTKAGEVRLKVPKLRRQAFETAIKTVDAAIKHPSGRLGAMVCPSQIDTCKEGFFKDALQEAQVRRIPMQTHACQAVVEFHEMIRRHGKTPIEWLDSIGVLGPDLIIGHGIFLSDHPQIRWPHANDFERLRDSGAAVAHCPTVFARREYRPPGAGDIRDPLLREIETLVELHRILQRSTR